MHANATPPPDESGRAFAQRLLAEHEKQAHAQQLNAAELVAVRELLEADRRWKWVAAGVKTWALWIAAVVAGSTVGLEAIKTAVKALGR